MFIQILMSNTGVWLYRFGPQTEPLIIEDFSSVSVGLTFTGSTKNYNPIRMKISEGPYTSWHPPDSWNMIIGINY